MRISDWSSDVCSSDLRVAGDGADLTVMAAAGRAIARRQPRGRRALRSPDRAGGVVPMLRRGECGAQPRRRPLPHDDLFGQPRAARDGRLEEQTSELQSLMRITYAVFGLKTNHNRKYISH